MQYANFMQITYYLVFACNTSHSLYIVMHKISIVPRFLHVEYLKCLQESTDSLPVSNKYPRKNKMQFNY